MIASRYPSSLYLSMIFCLSSWYLSSMNFLARNKLTSFPFSLVFFITRFNFLSVSTLLPSIVILWTFTLSFLSMFTSTYTCSLFAGSSLSTILTSAFLKPLSSKCLLIMIFARSIRLGVTWLPFAIPNFACKSSRSLFFTPWNRISVIRGRKDKWIYR